VWGKLTLKEWEEDQILLEMVEKRKSHENLENLPEKSIHATLSNIQNYYISENTSPISMTKPKGHKFGNLY
jgi:hypothetical protein